MTTATEIRATASGAAILETLRQATAAGWCGGGGSKATEREVLGHIETGLLLWDCTSGGAAGSLPALREIIGVFGNWCVTVFFPSGDGRTLRSVDVYARLASGSVSNWEVLGVSGYVAEWDAADVARRIQGGDLARYDFGCFRVLA